VKELPRDTGYYFEQFACVGDWTGHARDEERFRDFIHAAHRYRAKLTEREVRERLLTRGFAEDDASELAELYRFGRDLLRRRPAFNYIGPKSIKVH